MSIRVDSTGVHKSLGFNSMEEQGAFIKEYEDYSAEEIKNDMRSKEDRAGKAVILLLSKSYNRLLSKLEFKE